MSLAVPMRLVSLLSAKPARAKMRRPLSSGELCVYAPKLVGRGKWRDAQLLANSLCEGSEVAKGVSCDAMREEDEAELLMVSWKMVLRPTR